MQKLRFLWQKLWSKSPVLAYDVGSVLFSWWMAYLIRFGVDTDWFLSYRESILFSSVAVLLIHTVYYYLFRVYRGLWRFSSISDLFAIIKAAVATQCTLIPFLFFTSTIHSVPRSIFFIYFTLIVGLQGGARLFARTKFDSKRLARHKKAEHRVLIVGAGAAGEGLVRDMKRSVLYEPIAFLDDAPAKDGLSIHGVRVVGPVHTISDVARKLEANLIVIAIPSAGSTLMRRLLLECNRANIPVRTLPGLTALTSDQVEINNIRDIQLEDLLGRDQVFLEWNKISASLKGKKVLITGGGGSIGSELCRQVLTQDPESILILDHSEFNLYSIEQELYPRKEQLGVKVAVALASVTDSSAVDYEFSCFKPDIVFHAAAYKHVPMLEDQVEVAVSNNIVGTINVAQAAVANNVDQFVLISTDKAVNPTNIMGTTKRVAEIYCQNLNKKVDTQFITVRFGNVLGSAGSVVPLFRKQLQAGGPLTVTHPEISRYFMTIPEACQLILQSMVNGLGGEIFVLDMGQPIKIKYLAEQIIRLSGKEPGKDVSIVYTGLRPGEKLYEELFHASEKLAATTHEKIFKARVRDLDFEQLHVDISLLEQACREHHKTTMLTILKKLVPEYQNEVIETLKERIPANA